MHRLRLVWLLLLAGVLGCGTPETPEPGGALDVSASGLTTEEVVAFLADLQRAVAADDRAAVAARVSYPLDVPGGAVETPGDLVDDYDRIVTGRVREAVLNASPDGLFASWQGIMVGDGAVWFGGVGDEDGAGYTVKITGINP